MKVETSKNQTIDKKESKNVFKTETSVFNASDPLKTAQNAPPPTESAFAKILEETRKENEKNNQGTAKTEFAEHDSKASESERDEKPNRVADEKKEAEEQNSKNGDGDASQNGDENQTQANALALLQTQTTANSEVSAPPARSILHIADLERIVSTVRTETFQNQKQIIIALKNSVLQGLQIKLTLTESGQLKAEFLALDEQIKKQLKQRKNELSEILKNRSPLFSEIEVKSQNEDTNT